MLSPDLQFKYAEHEQSNYINEVRNPKLFWGIWYSIIKDMRDKDTHFGYQSLAVLVENPIFEDWFIVTTNIYGMLDKLDIDATKRWEINGSLKYVQCEHGELWPIEGQGLRYHEKTLAAFNSPVCQCGKLGIVRPNVVMYNDTTWNSKRSDN